MSDKYKAVRDRASATLLAKGQPIQVIRLALASGSYDPLAPVAAPTVQAAFTTSGVVLPRSKGAILAFDERILDDPDRLAKFRYVIISGKDNTFRPEARDFLRSAEGDYKIDGLVPVDPTGEGPIIFQCYCSLDTPAIAGAVVNQGGDDGLWHDDGTWDD